MREEVWAADWILKWTYSVLQFAPMFQFVVALQSVVQSLHTQRLVELIHKLIYNTTEDTNYSTIVCGDNNSDSERTASLPCADRQPSRLCRESVCQWAPCCSLCPRTDCSYSIQINTIRHKFNEIIIRKYGKFECKMLLYFEERCDPRVVVSDAVKHCCSIGQSMREQSAVLHNTQSQW